MSDILSKKEIEHFIHSGFIRLDHAFSKELADSALDILWNDLPCNKSDPSTWIEPVIRLGMYIDEPFINSVNTLKLHIAFNQLIGKDKWIPCRSVGTFPVRFPSVQQPADTGKHVDASFPGNDVNNYLEWRQKFCLRRVNKSIIRFPFPYQNVYRNQEMLPFFLVLQV